MNRVLRIFFKKGPWPLLLVLGFLVGCGDQSLPYYEDPNASSSSSESNDSTSPNLNPNSSKKISHEGSFLSKSTNKKYKFLFPVEGAEEVSKVVISTHYLSNEQGGLHIIFESPGVTVKIDNNINKFFSWESLEKGTSRSNCLELEIHNGEKPVHLIITNCNEAQEDKFLLNSENFVSGTPDPDFEPDAIQWDEWIKKSPSLLGKDWSFDGEGSGVQFLGVERATLGH